MKRNLYLLVGVFLSATLTYGQQNTTQGKPKKTAHSSGHIHTSTTHLTPQSTTESGAHSCKTFELTQQHYSDRNELNEFNQNAINGALNASPIALPKTPGVNEISIIFHVVHNPNNPAENVSNALIMQVYNDLTDDFLLLNDVSGVRPGFGFTPANSNINFCLATQDPSGTPLAEVGVVRVATTEQWYDSDNGEENKMKSSVTGGSQIWDRNQYLNVWICDISNGASAGTAGYAYRPSPSFLPSSSIDGIVLDYNIGVNNPNVLTHEVGHYLGLDHTWGGSGGCGSDDGFADTPNTAGPSFNYPGSCSGSQQTCGGTETQYENYMDYSNCTAMFTQGQANYMLSILQGIRSSLLISPGCDPVDAPPVVDFTADVNDPIIIPVGGSVNFFSQATNAPTSWTWDFGGGSPAQTAENPNVTFNTVGTYTVTHTATNAFGTGTEIKTNHVQVVAAASGTGCDTLRNYNPTDDLFTLNGATGYVTGNEYFPPPTDASMLEWAEPYTATNTTEVRRLVIAPTVVSDGGGDIIFKVYTDNAGAPGTVMATETVPLSGLTALVWNEVDFATPATVTGNFWVGYELSYANPTDTFALLTTFELAATPTIDFTMANVDGFGWFKSSDLYGDGGGNSLGTAFAMDVLTSTGADPSATFTLSEAEICAGGDVVVNGSASTNVTNYFWYQTDNPFTTIEQTGSSGGVTFNMPNPGDYSIYLFGDGSCKTSAVFTDFTVNPTVNATVTPTNTTCGNNNGVIAVTAPTGGNGTYEYSMDGVNWTSNGTFNNVPSGNYDIHVRTPGSNCETIISTTVGTSSEFVATVSPNVSVCPGQSATISASGGVSYDWYDGASSIATSPSTSVSPAASTQYSCIVTDAVGCQSTVQTTVTVYIPATAPTISTSGSTTICAGESVDLTSSYPTNNNWSTTETSSSITVSTAGMYSVTYTDGNGCTSTSAMTTVTVNSAPSISAGTVTNPSTCATATGSIQVSGSGSGDLSWTGTSSGNMTGTTLPVTIPTLSAGAYNITFTDGNGCTSNLLSESLSDPNPPATPTITPSGPLSFCDGGSVNLTSSEGSGNTWSSTEMTQTITVTSSGTFSVTYTDANGCSAPSTPITVVVNPIPSTPVITPSGSTTFCQGESVDLTSSQGTGNAWSSSETTQTITVTNSGDYNVTYTDANGCSATSADMTVTVNESPVVTLTSNDATTCLDNGPSTLVGTPAGGTYSGPGVTSDQFDPAVAGVGAHILQYDYTDANGCSGSNVYTIVVDDCSSIEEELLSNISIYPNPTRDQFTIQLDGAFDYELVDAQGRLVIAKTAAIDTAIIQSNQIETGIYFITIHTEGVDATLRLIKQ